MNPRPSRQDMQTEQRTDLPGQLPVATLCLGLLAGACGGDSGGLPADRAGALPGEPLESLESLEPVKPREPARPVKPVRPVLPAELESVGDESAGGAGGEAAIGPGASAAGDSIDGVAVLLREEFFPSGRPRRSYWIAASSAAGAPLEHGPDLAWFETTQKRWEINWRRGQREGFERRWYKSGSRRSEGRFVGEIGRAHV